MKKLIITLAVIVCLLFAAIVTLVLVVDPNQFKPLLVREVKKSTGLDLSINADISWKFFPTFGLEVGEIALKNPEGFSRMNLATVDNVSFNVELLPLLDHELQVGEVSLNGADIQLEKLKSGRTNYEFNSTQTQPEPKLLTTSKGSSSSGVEKTGANEKQEKNPWRIAVAGIDINHAKFSMIDQVKNSKTDISDLTFSLSDFQLDSWAPFSFAIVGDMDQQNFQLDGNGEFKIDQQFKKYALRNIHLNTVYSNPDLNIDKASMSMASFELGKPGLMQISVNMKGDKISGKVEGQSGLLVDSSLKNIQLSEIALNGDLSGSLLPVTPFKFDFNSNISVNTERQHISITIPQFVLNDMTLDGQFHATLSNIPKVRFDFHGNKLDLDKLFATPADIKQKKGISSQKQTQITSSASNEVNRSSSDEPDLSVLSQVDIAGSVRIDDVKANNVKLSNLMSAVHISKGKVVLSKFRADLYDGTVQAKAVLNATKKLPVYNVDTDFDSVQIQPLLIALADKEVLEGSGTIKASLNGKSLSADKLMKNLAGTVDLDFADGAINGINIPQMIRVQYAKFKGESVTSEEEAVKKTDFSSLTATVNLKDGVASTSNLKMASPLLRINGKGSANYIQKTTDFLVRTSLVKSLEGQGGQGIDKLRDVTIPIKVTGPWGKPKYRIVFDDVLKQKAEKELDRGLKKLDGKIKDEKTKKALNSLLKGLLN